MYILIRVSTTELIEDTKLFFLIFNDKEITEDSNIYSGGIMIALENY